jgi:hypothetical protein
MQAVCEVKGEVFGRLYCKACQTSKRNAPFQMFSDRNIFDPLQHVVASLTSVFHVTTLVLCLSIKFWNSLGTNEVWLGVKA